ncbi:DUF6932 family protein [Psychrobacter urativorans]|uniref:DUF6932 family protein n=1 Tax=Psychrobacter urativorans TaxID=45610 RepID=UPI00191B3CEF|nr:hypothetical protein [Psychrobacter urativorans]
MWNIRGVIPPVALNEEGHSYNRSPYSININKFIKDFAFSSERIEILIGFLAYRQAIYSSGIETGFQWVNGSFAENVESIADRAPNDIDIVTFSNFYHTIPDYPNWAQRNIHLFDNPTAKNKYKVDSYWVDMDLGFNEASIRKCTYWYSMWSHQRDTDIWKGFFVIPLSPSDDNEAMKYLSELKIESNHA